MSATPRTASVVIPCYNYGRFVGHAIESALRQTRPFCDVIVVDDGSLDNSWAVIESYGTRVRGVHKENGGHASSLNVGCQLARGDVIFLLDADDELRSEAVEVVLGAWRPETVLLQSRPSLMDGEGRDLPGTVPGPWIRLAEGDVRKQLLETGTFYIAVTSGLVLRRDAVERVMPIPEARFRQAADGYLVRAVAFEGHVQAVDQPLSKYRLHGENDTALGLSPEQIAQTLRKRIAYIQNELEIIRDIGRQQGLEAAADLGERQPDHLFLRLGSLAADPSRHTVAGDSRLRLLVHILRGIRASPPMVLPGARMAFVATAVAVLPGRLGARLLAWSLAPPTRPPWLASLAAWLRRRRET